MQCFPLLRTVLDEVWAQMAGTDDQKCAEIRACAQYLRDHYRQLASGAVALDYRHPATRYAYLCCYVTSHANIVATRIGMCRELSALFERDRVQVSCIGGGPGSDLLGVLKYTDSRGLSPAMKFFLYDREQAWSEAWSDVDDKLGKPISTYFQPFDVTLPATWASNAKYLQSDLFTMIYFASEVHAVRDQAMPFFTHLFDYAKPGALFLYVDNSAPVFFNWFDAIWTGRGVSALYSVDSVSMQMPGDEQKTDLGEHMQRIAGFPKLTANIAYRVLRKD